MLSITHSYQLLLSVVLKLILNLLLEAKSNMSALDLNALELCRNCTVNVKCETYQDVQEVQMNIHICLSVCTRSSDEHTYTV